MALRISPSGRLRFFGGMAKLTPQIVAPGAPVPLTDYTVLDPTSGMIRDTANGTLATVRPNIYIPIVLFGWAAEVTASAAVILRKEFADGAPPEDTPLYAGSAWQFVTPTFIVDLVPGDKLSLLVQHTEAAPLATSLVLFGLREG